MQAVNSSLYKALIEKKLYVFYVVLKKLWLDSQQTKNNFIYIKISLNNLAKMFNITKEQMINHLKSLIELNLIRVSKIKSEEDQYKIILGTLEGNEVRWFMDKSPEEKENKPKVAKKGSEFIGRYSNLDKTPEDVPIVSLLREMNILFYEKFNFSETTEIYKQMACLKKLIKNSENPSTGEKINLGTIKNAYKYALDNFELYGLDTVTLPAFCAYFNSIYTGYIKSSKKQPVQESGNALKRLKKLGVSDEQ